MIRQPQPTPPYRRTYNREKWRRLQDQECDGNVLGMATVQAVLIGALTVAVAASVAGSIAP